MSWKNSNQPALGLADEMLLEHGEVKKLDPIQALIDWDAIEKHLTSIHNKRRGSPAYPPLKMLKVLLLQAWYGVSDTDMEARLARDLLFRRFTGFGLELRTPDHSTIWNFRQQLHQMGALEKILDEVNSQLERKGVMVTKGKVAVDATVIESVRSRPKKNRKGKNTQDPEAAYNVKVGSNGKRRTTYGYKLHAKTDTEGLIRKLAYTAGNVHDSRMLPELMDGDEREVYADSAYAGKKIASLLGNKNRILHRPYRNTPLTEWQRRENATRQQTRNVIERTFAHLKIHFGLTKARYLRLARNHAFALLTAIAYNLKRTMPKIQCAL